MMWLTILSCLVASAFCTPTSTEQGLVSQDECTDEVTRFRREALATASSAVCEQQEIIPNPGTLVNIFPQLGAEFKLSFDLWVDSRPTFGDASVILVQPDGQENTYSPSIQFSTYGNFRVSIGTRKADDWVQYKSPKFESKKWIHIEASQKKDVLGLFLFKVTLDDVTYTVTKPAPKGLQNVKLYAGAPGDEAVKGKIKNFYMVSL